MSFMHGEDPDSQKSHLGASMIQMIHDQKNPRCSILLVNRLVTHRKEEKIH
jgi:hypothetical protein